MSLKFSLEWESAPGVTDPAEARSWARIEIMLGTCVASQLLDLRQNTSRTGFYGSTLPLAEWLVESWPRLIHERRVPPPNSSEEPEWTGFHFFRASRQGGAFPDLQARRINNHEIELLVHPDSDQLAPGISVRFLSKCRSRVPAEDVERELSRIVDATLERLKEAPVSERLSHLRSRWISLRDSQLARAAARLGLDVEALEMPIRERLEGLLSHPRADALLALAEGSLAPTALERIEEASQLMERLPDRPPVSSSWQSLQQAVRHQKHQRPWKTGWAAAEEFRRVIDLKEDKLVGDKLREALATHLGWAHDQQLEQVQHLLQGVDAVHIQEAGRMPAVLTTARHPGAQRFRLARSLYHLIFTEPSKPLAAFADSPLLASELSESNAFAAELLAPVKLLRESAPPSGVWDSARCHAIARSLKVSPKVIEHQIENRDLGRLAA